MGREGRKSRTIRFSHLRFAMRYEPLDIGVLASVFANFPEGEMQKWVGSERIAKYVRQAWYLYELLTRKTLDVPDATTF